jgi:hypothetical protein
MLTENQYINILEEDRELSDKDILMFRKQYRSMTKKEKKKLDREYIIRKQKLSGDGYSKVVYRNIKNGKRIHEEKTSNNVYRYNSDGELVLKDSNNE